MFRIMKPVAAGHSKGHPKVTCVTCHLKRCVGHCRWEAAPNPKAPKAA